MKSKLNGTPRFARRLCRVAMIGLLPGILGACTNALEYAYGNAGPSATVVSGQEKDLRRVDLVVLLDPANVRTTAPIENVFQTDAEVIRAREAFGAYENNFPEYVKREDTEQWSVADWNKIARADVNNQKCSPTGDTHGKLDTTTKTRVTMRVVRTREDTQKDVGGGKRVNTQGPVKEIIESVDTVVLSKPPTFKPADICEIERRMMQRRNEIAAQLMAASDTNCNRYMTALQQYKSDVNFFSALTTVGLGAVGSLAKGSANALAAAAGATGAIPTAFNEAYFQGVALTAVTKAMRGDRVALEQEIRTKKFGKPPSEYTITDALKDANDYHTRCSLNHGLELVTEAVNQKFDASAILKAAGFGAGGGGSSGGAASGQ